MPGRDISSGISGESQSSSLGKCHRAGLIAKANLCRNLFWDKDL